MKRPVPPSNFLTRNPETREDLRRLRENAKDILDWIDAEVAAGGGGSSGVTSFNGRTGVVVPGSSDYTKSDVGLGSVTNDAQLKRADSDWAGFTTQTGLAAGDKFLIERASDTAKRVVLASSLSAASSPRDPIWDPPTTAGANNDEFTVDTLASGAWTLSGFTRDGAVDMTVACAANHYRSSVIGSTLWVQWLKTDTLVLHKTVAAALSTDQLWFLAYGGVGDYPSTQPQVTLGIMRNNAGSPDFNNEIIVRTANSVTRIESFSKTGGALVSNNVGSQLDSTPQLDGLYLRVNHGSAAALNGYGGAWARKGLFSAHLAPISSLQFNQATDRIVIVISASHTQDPYTGVGQSLVGLHFLRHMPTNGVWFAQV